ncbi:MAG: hypothetical protein AAFV69_08690 [Pseudomonadota bacterium]
MQITITTEHATVQSLLEAVCEDAPAPMRIEVTGLGHADFFDLLAMALQVQVRPPASAKVLKLVDVSKGKL